MSRRKTAEEHELSGSLQRPTAGDSYVAGSLPRPPKFLSKEAKAKFRALVRQLADRRAVTAGDGDLLTLYCSLWNEWVEELAAIKAEGRIRTYTRLGADGIAHEVERENLHVKLAQNAISKMFPILKQLGLTPRDKDAVRPTAPVKPKNAPPHPDSAEGLGLEIARLRALTAAQQEAEAPPEIDLNSPELMEAMEKII
jgi:P27 family predicted phage terminase small subunit